MTAVPHERAPRPESRWADLDGPVHFLDFGGPADGPLVVCVHGLGGSAVNWAAVAPTLAQTCRVVAIDLAGFGHTLGGSRSTSVQANNRLLHRFLVEVAGTPAILIGNSMGGLISIRQAARRAETVAGLVLVDPALPPALRARPDPKVFATFAAFMVPVVGRRMVRRPRDEESALQGRPRPDGAVLRRPRPDPSRGRRPARRARRPAPRVPRRRLRDAHRRAVAAVGARRPQALRGDAPGHRRARAAAARRPRPADQHRLRPGGCGGEPALAVRDRPRRGARAPARGAAVDHRRHPRLARAAPRGGRPRLPGQDVRPACGDERAAPQLARRGLPPARERPPADARRLAAGLRGPGADVRRAGRARAVVPRQPACATASGCSGCRSTSPARCGSTTPTSCSTTTCGTPRFPRRVATSSCARCSAGCSRSASTRTARCGSCGSSRA